MATEQEVIDQLNSNTERLNNIETIRKNIADFPLKSPIDGSEDIAISGAEKITVQQILDLLNIGGSIKTAVTSKNASYTATSDDSTIICFGGSFTITLPSAVGIDGRMYLIKNIDTGTITIDADGTETIEGDLSIDIFKGEALEVQSDGSNWIII